MMQLVIVVFFVSVAISYLAYLFYSKFIKKQPPCDGCAFGKSAHQESHE
jgi:hypothetical protein